MKRSMSIRASQLSSSSSLQLYYCLRMKNKLAATTLNKKITQKTTLPITIHSYRNSNFSQNLPLNYNDSLLSLRSNFISNQLKSTYLEIQNTEPNQKKANDSRQKSKTKKNTKDKTNVSTKKSETRIKFRRNSQICSLQYQRQRRQYSITKKAKNSQKKHGLSLLQLNIFQNRVQQVLNKYKRYTEHLKKQVKNYKFKYHSLMKILKKATKVQR